MQTPEQQKNILLVKELDELKEIIKQHNNYIIQKNDDVINEIDFSDAFGYVETKDKDFKETLGTLKKMGIDDPEERLKRTKQFLFYFLQ